MRNVPIAWMVWCLYPAMLVQAQQATPESPGDRAGQVFERLDRTGDGQLERSEWPQRLVRSFARIDADHSGGISRDELAAFSGTRSLPDNRDIPDGDPGITDPYLIYNDNVNRLAIRSIDLLQLDDRKRGKTLALRVTFPTAGGPFPVIVFSHGLYGSKDNYLALTRFWAASGYVVIQPNHQDSLAGGARYDDPANLRRWPERPADVSLIIDSLPELESREPALAGKMNRQRIGVGGHSLGAGTSQLVAGATATLQGRPRSFADDRVAAALLMSSQGPGGILSQDSWRNITIPMMVTSGSADGPTRTGQPAQWRKQPYELSPPGNKHLVWIEGLDHGFGNLTGSGRYPEVPAHQAYVKATTLAFWDAYLKGSSAARQLLTSNRISGQTGGRVDLKWK